MHADHAKQLSSGQKRQAYCYSQLEECDSRQLAAPHDLKGYSRVAVHVRWPKGTCICPMSEDGGSAAGPHDSLDLGPGAVCRDGLRVALICGPLWQMVHLRW